MTREIQLTRGQVALVDDDLYEYLNQWKWQASGTGKHIYAVRVTPQPERKAIGMHRQIMNNPEGFHVDHINFNTLDNRRENLRICTRFQNLRNTRISKNATSGLKGVCWHKKRHKWQAQIFANGKQIHLGLFESREDAGLARDEAAIKYHGEFAWLNFPERRQAETKLPRERINA